MQDSIDHGIGLNSERIVISDHARRNLQSAVRWARLVALGGFFLSAFVLIMALIWFKFGAAAQYNRQFHFVRAIIAIGLSVILFLPGFYVQRFSSNIRRSLEADDQIDFEVGVDYLKTLFRLLGIYSILIIIAVLLFLGLFIYVQLILTDFPD